MSSSGEEPGSWISSTISKPQLKFLCAVERGFIEDGFNLYGLKATVANYNSSLEVILDRVEEDDSEAGSQRLSWSAAGPLELFGLIHARFIITSRGLEAMHAKYLRHEFGRCPRYFCHNHPVLPLGLHDAVGIELVRLYCPRCGEVYRAHQGSETGPDGAYFGTTFAQLFLMTYGYPRPRPAEEVYVPRVFGFRVHRSAADRVNAAVHGSRSQSSLQQAPATQAAAAAAMVVTNAAATRLKKRARSDDDDAKPNDRLAGEKTPAATAGDVKVKPDG